MQLLFSLEPINSPEGFRARHLSTQVCKHRALCTLFPSENTQRATSALGCDVPLLFSCCSQTALGIHLTAGEEQCHFHEPCQIFTCSAQDLSPPLIKGNAIGAAAIGNHNQFSHQNKVSEARGAQILFLEWNSQGDSWLLLQFCFGPLSSELPCGFSLKFVCLWW